MPVLVHGVVNDEICPYVHSLRLQEHLVGMKRNVRLESFEEGGHNDYVSENSDRYYGSIKDFIHPK